MSQFEFITALRYSRPKGGAGTAGLLSGLSLAGLTLSVFGLIVVMSVMNGFERELQSRMLSLIPHAKLQLGNASKEEWQAVRAQLLEKADVVAVAPYLEGTMVLSNKKQISVSRFVGVDTAIESQFSPLDSLMIAGSLEQLSQPFTLAVGSSMARRLGLTIGDSVTALLPRVQITPFGPIARERQLIVVAVFESGTELDASLAYSNLDTARKMLGKSQAVDGLKVNTSEAYAERSFIESLLGDANTDGEFTIKTWQEDNAALYAAVAMEKLMIFVLLLSVVAVASFSIIAIVLMSVLDKKTDIAILRTMGASAGQIRQVFLLQGAIIGVIGTLIGAALATIIAPHVGEVFSAIESLFSFRLFDPNVYYIAHLPSELRMGDVFTVVVVSIVISVVVSVFPAARASKVDPVVALSAGK